MEAAAGPSGQGSVVYLSLLREINDTLHRKWVSVKFVSGNLIRSESDWSLTNLRDISTTVYGYKILCIGGRNITNLADLSKEITVVDPTTWQSAPAREPGELLVGRAKCALVRYGLELSVIGSVVTRPNLLKRRNWSMYYSLRNGWKLFKGSGPSPRKDVVDACLCLSIANYESSHILIMWLGQSIVTSYDYKGKKWDPLNFGSGFKKIVPTTKENCVLSTSLYAIHDGKFQKFDLSNTSAGDWVQLQLVTGISNAHSLAPCGSTALLLIGFFDSKLQITLLKELNGTIVEEMEVTYSYLEGTSIDSFCWFGGSGTESQEENFDLKFHFSSDDMSRGYYNSEGKGEVDGLNVSFIKGNIERTRRRLSPYVVDHVARKDAICSNVDHTSIIEGNVFCTLKTYAVQSQKKNFWKDGSPTLFFQRIIRGLFHGRQALLDNGIDLPELKLDHVLFFEKALDDPQIAVHKGTNAQNFSGIRQLILDLAEGQGLKPSEFSRDMVAFLEYLVEKTPTTEDICEHPVFYLPGEHIDYLLKVHRAIEEGRIKQIPSLNYLLNTSENSWHGLVNVPYLQDRLTHKFRGRLLPYAEDSEGLLLVVRDAHEHATDLVLSTVSCSRERQKAGVASIEKSIVFNFPTLVSNLYHDCGRVSRPRFVGDITSQPRYQGNMIN